MIAVTFFALKASTLRAYQASSALRTGFDLSRTVTTPAFIFVLVGSCVLLDGLLCATAGSKQNAKANTANTNLFISSPSLIKNGCFTSHLESTDEFQKAASWLKRAGLMLSPSPELLSRANVSNPESGADNRPDARSEVSQCSRGRLRHSRAVSTFPSLRSGLTARIWERAR